MGGKRRKKSGWAKKIINERSKPREVSRLASLADMFAILPVFCLFPPLRSLVPGYFVAVVAAQGERGRSHERPGASENQAMKSYGNLKIKRPDLATN